MAMDREQRNSPQWLCDRGIELLRNGDRLRALSLFEKSYDINPTAECRSYLGMLTGTERGLVKKGIDLCRAAIEDEPQNPTHYLNLGKLLYMVERKSEAVDLLVKARTIAPSEEVDSWIKNIGHRKRPVFPFLTRRNLLNKYTGLMLKRFGLR
jgi:tetratricopeptide (TPR) repeat protein